MGEDVAANKKGKGYFKTVRSSAVRMRFFDFNNEIYFR